MTKDDWLCKGCYGEWYRGLNENCKYGDIKRFLENKEFAQKAQQGLIKDDEASKEEIPPEEATKKKQKPEKEKFLKTVLGLLINVVKNLDPKVKRLLSPQNNA